MIRNLLCHVYPRASGRKWRRTATHLIHRREMFNGRRILMVATDETTDDIKTVRKAFAPLEAEIIESRNTEIQETATFLPSMDMIVSERSDEMTFRCHSKGCTHGDDNAPSHPWADVMFATCLDIPELIDCHLADKSITGAFQWIGPWPFPGMHGWHYSGSFYWFRHDRTFTRNWRWLMPNFFGVEGWPGIFPREESACVFHGYDNEATAHLYNHNFWRANIVPELRLWATRLREATGRSIWLPDDSLLPKWGFSPPGK